MFASVPRSLRHFSVLLVLLLEAPVLPEACSEEKAAPQPAAAASLPDTTGKEEPAAETPEERAERLKKRQADDRKSIELEAQRRSSPGKPADAREKAIDALRAQVKKAPASFDLRFKLANAYQEAGYVHSALAEYSEAARIDSTQSKAWVNRGVVLKELGRMDDASESFRRAIAVNPNDSLALINLGDMLLTERKYQEAVDAYRRALANDPASSNAYYSLAIAFAESGMYRDAARAWRKSAEFAEARGTAQDKSNAERARENAKLMDEIVADAVVELEARQKKQRELDAVGSKKDVPKSDAPKKNAPKEDASKKDAPGGGR